MTDRALTTTVLVTTVMNSEWRMFIRLFCAASLSLMAATHILLILFRWICTHKVQCSQIMNLGAHQSSDQIQTHPILPPNICRYKPAIAAQPAILVGTSQTRVKLVWCLLTSAPGNGKLKQWMFARQYAYAWTLHGLGIACPCRESQRLLGYLHCESDSHHGIYTKNLGHQLGVFALPTLGYPKYPGPKSLVSFTLCVYDTGFKPQQYSPYSHLKTCALQSIIRRTT